MNLIFIERIIQKINKEDIYNYSLNEGITLNNEELNTIYTYLKNYYKEFLYNKNIREKLLNELKSHLSIKVSKKIDELYSQHKGKI